MLLTLALRHLLVKRLRALFLLLGYALGVGVMIVLLSVGEAMLRQSRDVSLVGGGELTVLPQGIDLEAMRTGGVGGMFFAVERARYVGRHLLGGPRQRARVAAVAPAIENKLLYLSHGGRTIPVRAGGEIPSRAAAVGAGLRIVEGRWTDSPADRAWAAPTPQQLYDELDRFHLPPRRDSTWAEWQYYNVVAGPDEWWYVTYLVGGEIPDGRWGGQLLVTRRSPSGAYQRFTAAVPAESIAIDTLRADLTLGASTVRQRNGIYHLRGRAPGEAGTARIELSVVPAPNRYFPQALLEEGEFVSGYAVPALAARASGRLCVGARCREVRDAPAYHDHNWGVWRDVTWDWGTGSGERFNLLYGGVHSPDAVPTGAPPFFVMVVDSLGLKQVLRAGEIRYRGRRAASGGPGEAAPEGFDFVAIRERDTLRVEVSVLDALATPRTASGGGPGRPGRSFLQMRGRFVLRGRVAGEAVADSGLGFFETYVARRAAPLTGAGTRAPPPRPPRRRRRARARPR